MKPRFVFRMILVVLLLCSWKLFAEQGLSVSARDFFGSIAALEGEVHLNDTPATIGQKVFQEDKIKTAVGKVEIESDGSRFLIGPYSEITLGPPPGADHSFIHCIKGTLRSVMHKLLGRSFEVKTKYVTAGIRGTDFLLHTTPTAGVLFTEEGSVQFEANGQKVAVNQMQMSQAGEGILPLDPEGISDHPPLAVLLKEIEQFCDLNIPASISGKKELNDIIARWNLNFSGYWADKQEYEKAQKLALLAFLIAEKRELRAEARFWRGTIFLRFQRAAKTALEDFEEIIKNYSDTPFHEQALYNQGLAYYDLRELEKAKTVLESYLQTYPSGQFKESAQVLIKKILEELKQSSSSGY